MQDHWKCHSFYQARMKWKKNFIMKKVDQIMYHQAIRYKLMRYAWLLSEKVTHLLSIEFSDFAIIISRRTISTTLYKYFLNQFTLQLLENK